MFPIQNLPYGIFSLINSDSMPCVGVAIGDYVLDLHALHQHGVLNGLPFDTSVFGDRTLNRFMSLRPNDWLAMRRFLTSLLEDSVHGDTTLRNNEKLRKKCLIPQSDVKMHLPVAIGDYTDFYSSREHATNVGTMFRGKDNALQPNWLRLPVGYHGRSSSVVVSGTNVIRPRGQILPPNGAEPIYSDCKFLDFELELAVFLGNASDGENINELGDVITMDQAASHLFGVVLMNDWSARDIQSFEYVPLGPFTGIF